MIPVYKALHDWPAVAALVGTRIYREFGGNTPAAPYVVWGILAGVPDNNLSNLPPSDRYSIRVDTFSKTEAQSDALVIACRNAVEAARFRKVETIQSLGKETGTDLWRMTFDADWFANR